MSKFKELPSYFNDAPTPKATKTVTVKSDIEACPYDEPRSVNFPVRMNDYQRELIKRGSAQLGVSMVQFMRDASVEYAKKLGLY